MADYTGNVVVGGPPEVRELDAATITKIAVGPMKNNAYLLRCRATGETLFIDAAAEPERLLDIVDDQSLTLLVTTHQHPDHWQALSTMVSKTGVRTAAHPLDAPAIPVATDQFINDGDTLTIGELKISVIHLTGHTPGSIALLYSEPNGISHLFTGDSLFPGGLGNTHQNPDDFAALFHDVTTKLFDRLPDNTWVYPGHGPDTTLGAERPHLAEWRSRSW